MILTRGLGAAQRLITRGYGLAIVVVIPVLLSPLSGMLLFTPGRPSLDHGIAVKTGQITWLGNAPPVLGSPLSARITIPDLLLGGVHREELLQAAMAEVAQILPSPAPGEAAALEGFVQQAVLLLAEAAPEILTAEVSAVALVPLDAEEAMVLAAVERAALIPLGTGTAGRLLPPSLPGADLLQPDASEERSA